jgi:hypothetical protein
MSEGPEAGEVLSPTDPLWRATVEMADHALDPNLEEDSSLDADELPQPPGSASRP